MRVVSRVVDNEGASSWEYDPYNPVQISLYGRANPGAIKLAKIISSVRSEQASSRGHRGFQKKSLGRMPADALARSFLFKKRVHSSSQHTV
ncbi:hypothetical protein BAE44_0000099 [Dichanthelium oligosanthes]|uniref:Uncharacterized protein n=1 Tax=Dichanthelium oligosanthes TaxID=888268 RepID=A0A1E5WNB4_9POAL|nr:hypothetical protein BAE44_0000099 [Dichanthelium oligosanthes]